MRPHLGHVKDVPAVRLGVGRVHDLHKDVPLGVVAAVDGGVEVVDEVVWVLAGQPGGRLAVEVGDAQLALDVDLYVFEGAVLVTGAVFSAMSWEVDAE